ncbi:receptor-type tyrosine-protein phosphatase epsilon-like [Mya arenaria]|uniref:receptor-type tyrosine-protein phosphatase epsilon-like n=1 Tax=Mya arenaria TaxID=6604 RepID=UPI0022E6C3D4|nr:receptor-type tyrosine-protein phosphatase epsilon-like [Mya arenaria]
MTKQLGDFGQFWRMVWQQKVEKIVTLTQLVEGKNSKERRLHHLQFTSWLDKDIPDDVTSIIEFRQRVNALSNTSAGPIVVHCSAGVGRSGTYIALDILSNEGEAEKAINIPGCVFDMRRNRPNMIQSFGMVGLYFPGDNRTIMESFDSVPSNHDQSARNFVKRLLHIEGEGKTKKGVTISHDEYLDWDTKLNIPKSAEHCVAFIKDVEDASKLSHLNGPTLLHCLTGAEKSGLFCVVMTLLEQLSETSEVSVVNAVSRVRARRPLAIPNKEQFYFCHECAFHSVNATGNDATDDDAFYNISGNIQTG